VADNFTFTPGTGGSSRSKNPSGTLHIPYLYAATGEPTFISGASGIQTINVATGADSTLTVPSGATHALITVDTGSGNIRYWPNGQSPSSTVGLLVQAGGAVEVTSLANVKMRSTAGTTVVNVAYYHYTS